MKRNPNLFVQITKKVSTNLVGCLFVFLIFTVPSEAEFSGSPKVEFSRDGRNVTLLENMSYTDRENHLWSVPEGTKVNGASIPQPFFSLIGGPFSGKYRDASIIHDFYCVPRNRIFDSNRTHDVFHQAMISSGVDPAKAFVMYQAVKQFGPQWTEQQGRCSNHSVWLEASSDTDQSKLTELIDSCVENSTPTDYDPNISISNDAAIDFLQSLKDKPDNGLDVNFAVDEFIREIAGG